jgi:hypothetical protein
MVSASEKLAVGPVGAAVHLPWTAPGDIDIRAAARLGSRHGFSGEGCAITPLLFLDGTVYLIPDKIAAGPMTAWTLFESSMAENRCPCAPPSSVDVGLHTTWDLGKSGASNTEGWNVKFLARHPGTYTVTVHAFDHFGGQYNRSTTVDVH